MPGAYLVLALVFGAAPRLFGRASLMVLAPVAIVSLAAGVAGVAFGLRLYPATDVVIAAFALSGGVWIGRALPPRARPMAIFLAVLAALDAVQVFAATTGETNPSPFRQWTMFLVSTPLGSTAIGFADLLIVSAIGEHWRRREGSVVQSVLPGVLGFALAGAFTFLVYRGGIPLLPFVLAGWLITELASALAARRLSHAADAGDVFASTVEP